MRKGRSALWPEALLDIEEMRALLDTATDEQDEVDE
jgi:hypothetical protein